LPRQQSKHQGQVVHLHCFRRINSQSAEFFACLDGQVRVLGATMGAWGREKYGMKPVKKDCLDYWPTRLERLKEEILVSETANP